jgi:hypothetical protein
MDQEGAEDRSCLSELVKGGRWARSSSSTQEAVDPEIGKETENILTMDQEGGWSQSTGSSELEKGGRWDHSFSSDGPGVLEAFDEEARNLPVVWWENLSPSYPALSDEEELPQWDISASGFLRTRTCATELMESPPTRWNISDFPPKEGSTGSESLWKGDCTCFAFDP